MNKPTLENTLLKTIDNIPFYSKQEYQRAKADLNAGKIIYDVLESLPEIDGKALITSEREFIPKEKGYYILLQTSGSSGKPKKIYYTPASSDDMSVVGSKMLKAMGVNKDFIAVTNLPREPAASGYGFREFLKKFGLMDMVLWPGQDTKGMLSYVDQNMPEDRGLLLCGATSMIIRNYYKMPEEDRKEFTRILRKYKAKVLVGGEPINSERLDILKNEIGYSTVNNFFACTEGVLSSGYTETSDDFLLSGHNFHYMLKDSNGKIHQLDDIKGKTGELIVTSKTREGKRYGTVFVKYNLHDLFEVKDIKKDGSVLARYLDRADSVKHVGVGKVTENSLDEVVMRVGKKYGTKEWYGEITQENGLDRLHFYLERGNYTGDTENIEKALKSEIEKEMLEFEFMFKDKLVTISAELVQKDKVPFYKEMYKAKRLKDLRT